MKASPLTLIEPRERISEAPYSLDLPARQTKAPEKADASPSLKRFRLLHEIFEYQANARPNAVAIQFGRCETTYAQLERRANQLAHHLSERGIRPGTVVAMWLPRSVDTYVTLLGILKVGAAYLPLNPEFPMDRVAYMIENASAAALVTTAELAARHTSYEGIVVRVDADSVEIGRHASSRFHPTVAKVDPRDLCYIIYTSGSTGRPKGVMVEHRSACHLVCAEGDLFGVRPSDRVYQGFSIAFDASVEEIWLAFHAGATLVAATPEMAQAGPDLSGMLLGAGVTVLSCVPTLLSMLEEDVPTVRLLILGGETCPNRLVDRWTRPGRRLVNTYGPTEATVIATAADLKPGRSVTIGCPIPGYRVYLLDDGLRPVASGQVGEIWIGGVGLARGYVGLPGHTAARFVADPFAPDEEPGARIYRTGDLGRLDDEGRIEFHGRADSQVKIRGYRVELAEIESALMKAENVRVAACAAREDVPGLPRLVGYVVPANGHPIDVDRLRAQLRSQLPSYMVPGVIETVPDLPRLPSGKLDRKSLPAPSARGETPKSTTRRPSNPTEIRIAETWGRCSGLPPHAIGVDDDLFLDLGGHSLLAARLVSELRKDPRYVGASLADVYDHPTIAKLAAALDARVLRSAPLSGKGPGHAVIAEVSTADRVRHFCCGLCQTAGFYGVYGLRAFQWITPYLIYFLLLEYDRSMLEAAVWATVSAMVMFPLLVLGVVAAKWVVLGRIQAGRHPLWGGYYLRWWFVHNLIEALHLDVLCGTPLLPFVYRLFGARIGKEVHLETDDFAAFDLTSIGDGTSIDDHVALFGGAVEGGELVLGPVRIGRRCFIGARSVLREDTTMEDGARLEDLSLLPSGTRVPADETWGGSPARRVEASSAVVGPPPARTPVRRVLTVGLYALCVALIPLLPLAAFVPGLVLLGRIDLYAHPFLYLAAIPVVGACFVLLLTSLVVLLKWLLIGRVKAGTYPVHGGFYVRKWIVDRLLALSLNVAGSLHATLYIAPWYRALGAKLGRFVELSTATSITPDLLEIGEGGTIADEVSLSAARVERGWMSLTATRCGWRSFVGNGAVVPPGTVMADGSLIGVLSIAPAPGHEPARRGTSWLGSPPIQLPHRQTSAAFPERQTFRPSRGLRLARGTFEIFRVTLPPAGSILVAIGVLTATLELYGRMGLASSLLLLPVGYMGACAALALGVVLVKWAVMGRFRPFERPLWCPFVWRLEAVNALYEFMLSPLVLEPLQGTPWLPWYLRMLGARIGRRAYIHTTGFLEWDLVEIGDGAILNEDCVLQTHLFEDRVLKASRLRIGRGCEVGASAVVLYDSEMKDGSRLDALSLLMKGETLPEGTAWTGIPSAPEIRPEWRISGGGHA